MNQPELETLSYREPREGVDLSALNLKAVPNAWGGHKLVALTTKQPNQNLTIISEIEELISQVNEKLEKLDDGHYISTKMYLIKQAIEEIDLFQKTTLHELRKEFE